MQGYASFDSTLLVTPGSSFMLSQSQPQTPVTATGSTSEIDRFPREEFSFLPHIIQVLDKVETGKNEQEIKAMMRKLKDKVHRCQKILDDLPGADLSRERQERLRNEDKEILENKRKLRRRYLELQIFQTAATTCYNNQNNQSNQNNPPNSDNPINPDNPLDQSNPINPINPLESLESLESLDSLNQLDSLNSFDQLNSILPLDPLDPLDPLNLINPPNSSNNLLDSFEINSLELDSVKIK
ncbi:autotransporter domain-containing protein [Rhizophagus clarus]|uniref:Mediator of RNA polymerase II transcription subunit 9 n=1 Tax=Rhizophagus clarus TaxID=94130 RepID=A0A8H3M2S0_9GLOM|nr:autotransporter domain-containing protein [Rhizophagus clarus]